MIVELRLDENISPRVAIALRAAGIDAVAVRDRGLLHSTDAQPFARAFDEDRVVVTCNVKDFETLARTCEMHAGVVLLDSGDLVFAEQLAAVRRALGAIVERGDLVNTALRIDRDGALSFEAIPPP